MRAIILGIGMENTSVTFRSTCGVAFDYTTYALQNRLKNGLTIEPYNVIKKSRSCDGGVKWAVQLPKKGSHITY